MIRKALLEYAAYLYAKEVKGVFLLKELRKKKGNLCWPKIKNES